MKLPDVNVTVYPFYLTAGLFVMCTCRHPEDALRIQAALNDERVTIRASCDSSVTLWGAGENPLNPDPAGLMYERLRVAEQAVADRKERAQS